MSVVFFSAANDDLAGALETITIWHGSGKVTAVSYDIIPGARRMEDLRFDDFMNESSISFFLSDFTREVRNNIDRRERENDVKQVVSYVLSKCPNVTTVCVNTSIEEDEYEMDILKELVSRPQVIILGFSTLETSCVLNLLRRCVIPAVGGRDELVIDLNGLLMSPAQAEDIFEVLRTLPFAASLMVHWNSYNQDFLKVFSRYLQDQSGPVFLWVSWETEISPTLFNATCDIIFKSEGLETVNIGDVPLQSSHVEPAAQYLAHTVAHSKSIKWFRVGDDQDGALSMDLVQRELLRTAPVKNLDLFFSLSQDWLRISKGNENVYKGILSSHNVPLSLWPHILAKANACNDFTSHSSFDFMFFLMREKNDVLLQNVRRRKIRKRKRFQFESF